MAEHGDGSMPRIVVVTNGNYFANLVLTPLLQRRDYDIRVVLTRGLRRQNRNRLVEAARLFRAWGPRLALYKVAAYAIPAAGARRTGTPRLVRQTCASRGIEALLVRNVNEAGVVQRLADFDPHLVVSVSCPYRIRREVLDLARIGALNVHSSLLRAGAGVSTYLHALANGTEITGITVHEMVEDFDAGRIIEQAAVTVAPGMSAMDLFARQCRLGGDLLVTAVEQAIAAGHLDGISQDLSQRTYFSEPTWQTVRSARRRGHPLARVGDWRSVLSGA